MNELEQRHQFLLKQYGPLMYRLDQIDRIFNNPKYQLTQEEHDREYYWQLLRRDPSATIADAISDWLKYDMPTFPINSEHLPEHYIPSYDSNFTQVPIWDNHTTCLTDLDALEAQVPRRMTFAIFRRDKWVGGIYKLTRHARVETFPIGRNPTKYRPMAIEYRWVRIS